MMIRLPVAALVALSMLLLGACAGDDTPQPLPTDPSGTPDDEASAAPPTEDDEPTPAATDRDACALLDEAFLNDQLAGTQTVFGSDFEFQPPLQTAPTDFCSWQEANTSLPLQLTLESAATSEIYDHSGRAYNLDVEPVPVPQDGPGTAAVLLTDPAFAGAGQEDFAYGYFFLAEEVTVYVESVGLDIGADNLRALADEAATRLDAG